MRFFPAMVELRKQIAEGAIGEVKYVNATFGFRRENLPARYTDPKLGEALSSLLECTLSTWPP